MALNVICTIEIKNQAYEAGVKDGEAMKVVGFVNGAPASFATINRGAIERMIESAVESAKKNASEKLDVLKGVRGDKNDG